MSDPGHSEGVEELFHAALERPPEERQAFLDVACQGQEELRRHVESLLGWDGPELGIAIGLLLPGSLHLVFTDPRGERRVPIPDAAEPVTLGRGSDNDIAIVHPSVSRVHATLERRDGRLYVRDEGSKNGVFVNGSRVLESEVSPGDIVTLGTVEARVIEES